MKKQLAVLCMALGVVAALLGGQQDKPAPLTEEQRQEKVKERDRLWQEAQKLRATGKLAEAIAAVEKAVSIQRALFGSEPTGLPTLLSFLAGLQEAREDFAAARNARQEVLDLKTKLWGAGHWEVTNARLALVHVELLAKLDRDQRRQLTESLQLAQRAVGMYQKGKPTEAIELLGQALEIYKQVLGDKHPDYAAGLNRLALLYHKKGDYAKAEPLYRQALEIRKQVLGENHPAYASSLHNLAALHETRGDYAKAEPLYRQALETTKQALGEKHPDYARGLNSLAALYHGMGAYAQAEPLVRQAMEIRSQALGEKHPDYAISLNDLALLYLVRGDYAKAEPLLQKALDIQKQSRGDKHPEYATALNNLALLYKNQGDFARAEPLLRKALGAVHLVGHHEPLDLRRLDPADLRPLPSTVLLLHNHGRVSEGCVGPIPDADRLRDCDRSYGLAVAALERVRQETLEHSESKVQFGAEVFDLFPRRIGLLRRLYALEGKAEDLRAAFTTAEQGIARVFLESLGKSRSRVLGGVTRELQRQEDQLLAELRQFDLRIDKAQSQPSERRDAALVGRLFDERRQTEERLQQLICRMECIYPQYAALKYPRPCTLAEARSCLGDNEAALLFVQGSAVSYVVLVEGSKAKGPGISIFPSVGSDKISEAVATLTDTDVLGQPARARALGAAAYRLLLAPLAEKIQGKDLMIVPGGPLGHLPFELLVEPADEPGKNRYLVEGHRIRYAPSLTALHLVRQWEKARAQPESVLWAMGDPVYDRSDPRLQGKEDITAASKQALAEYLARASRGPAPAGLQFQRLRFSGTEVEAIRGIQGVRKEDVLTGLSASEALVKAASEKGLLARARYLHFATHGILGLDTGRQPALVLSLVGNDTEDGFLQLDEVTSLKLNADLVVLSACRTGQGRLHNGEGVRGLARAFLYAGSRAVLCSLWSVDDEQTAQLMADVYRGLKAGKSSPDALREAQLKMIRTGEPPLYWAPFILIGE